MRRDGLFFRSFPRAAREAVAVATYIGAAAVGAFAGESAASAALLDEPPRVVSFKLDDPAAPKLSLLRVFQNAEVERLGPLRRYLGGPWGSWRAEPWVTLLWGAPQEVPQDGGERVVGEDHSALLSHGWGDASERLFGFEAKGASTSLSLISDASASSGEWLKHLDPEWSSPSIVSTGASLVSSGFDLLWASAPKPVPNWRCRRRPVTFMRYGGESDTFDLVRCDGAVAPEALDRISIMARPPEAKGPEKGELLPDEPEVGAWEENKEWLPQIRLVNPRLLWALQKVADSFPRRAVYIFSGYRPRAVVRGGTHASLHSTARAIDISVLGVSNVALFDACRKLDDVGCGYYPNSKFIHIDVRPPGTGHVFWIDASGPGEAPRYVDSWPGVVTSGGMAWDGQHASVEETQSRASAPGASNLCSKGPEGGAD